MGLRPLLGLLVCFSAGCSLEYLDRETGEASLPPGPKYYVAPTGSDDNACEQARAPATPRRTIAAAASCLLPGDTLLVRGGSYDEALTTLPSGESWDSPVRIAAYPDETVWLEPSSAQDQGYVINLSGAEQYVELDGINIDAKKTEHGRPLRLEGWAEGNPHHIRVQNAEIIAGGSDASDGMANGFYAINVTASVPGLIGGNEFINLSLHGGRTGTDPGDFAYALNLGTSDNLVDGCDVFDWSGGGIQLYPDGAPPPENNVIRNNRVHDITRSPDTRLAAIIVYAASTSIYNNVIYAIAIGGDGPGDGIGLNGPENRVLNNTVYGNGGVGINASAESQSSVVQNNIGFDNRGGDFYEDASSGNSVSHNLFGKNPLFVDAAGADFRLEAGSLAIDAGETLPEVKTAIDGTARPQGGAYDIGAYER